MQETSALYKQIIESDVHWFETKISIAGNEMTNGIMSLDINRLGFKQNSPSVGGALSATLDLNITEPSFTIPTRAEIVVYIRATDGVRTSEWLTNGIFYIDTRERNKDASSLETIFIRAYDKMLMFERQYSSSSLSFPAVDTDVVAEMASTVGVSISPLTYQYMGSQFSVSDPSQYTMREVLQHIAAMYCGNFVITSEGELLLVPIWGFDDISDMDYLADENGDALVFGSEGWFIIV